MANQDDVGRIALALDGVSADGLTYRVDGHLVCWPWMERIDPKKARVANLGVLVVRVASEMDKGALIDSDPAVFFTEPHYDGYAMVLIRLAAIDESLLAKLIADSWALAKAKPKSRSKRR
jgi:hypothetical protein